MPSGSPGIFRRKSSTADLPPFTPHSVSARASIGNILAHKMAVSGAGVTHTGWPNSKDDYELKEVIGQYELNIACSVINVTPPLLFVCM